MLCDKHTAKLARVLALKLSRKCWKSTENLHEIKWLISSLNLNIQYLVLQGFEPFMQAVMRRWPTALQQVRFCPIVLTQLHLAPRNPTANAEACVPLCPPTGCYGQHVHFPHPTSCFSSHNPSLITQKPIHIR